MNIEKQKLIIIAGPNGSGETSVTNDILEHEWIEGCVYINPDIITQEEFGDLNSSLEDGKVYVSAFPDFAEFRKHTANIAWETEVWIVESPDHMIHFNGDGFLGPR